MSQLDLLEREPAVVAVKAAKAAREARVRVLSEPKPEGWTQEFPVQPPRRAPQSTWMPWLRSEPWGWVCTCGAVAFMVRWDYQINCEHCEGKVLKPGISVPLGWMEKHRGCRR